VIPNLRQAPGSLAKAESNVRLVFLQREKKSFHGQALLLHEHSGAFQVSRWRIGSPIGTVLAKCAALWAEIRAINDVELRVACDLS